MTFSRDDILAFKVELLSRLLAEAAAEIRPKIPSRTLQRSMVPRIDVRGRNAKGDLFIAEFWALFVHDGTRAFGPSNAKFLVYFVNPADDPRKPGGVTPRRASQVRRLTEAEFRAGLAENARLARLNPGGGPMQHMIIVRTPSGSPGRVGPKEGSFFFERGAEGFEGRVDELVSEAFNRFVCGSGPGESLVTRVRG